MPSQKQMLKKNQHDRNFLLTSKIANSVSMFPLNMVNNNKTKKMNDEIGTFVDQLH